MFLFHQSPMIWYLKNQNSVKRRLFRTEFMAAKLALSHAKVLTTSYNDNYSIRGICIDEN